MFTHFPPHPAFGHLLPEGEGLATYFFAGHLYLKGGKVVRPEDLPKIKSAVDRHLNIQQSA